VTEARAKATQIQVNPAIRSRSSNSRPRRARSRARCRGSWWWSSATRAQVGPELPRPAGAARGTENRITVGAQPLHPVGGRTSTSRSGSSRPTSPPCCSATRSTELHGRERSGNRASADGGLLHPAPARARIDPPARRRRAARLVGLVSAFGTSLAQALRAALGVAALLLVGRRGAGPAARPGPAAHLPVTDVTEHAHARQVAALDAKLRAFEQAKASQVAVLVVRTTQPEEIEQYAIRVAEAWKLGRRNVDDGAILSWRSTTGSCASEVATGSRRAAGTRSPPHHRRGHRARCFAAAITTAASPSARTA